MAPKDILLPFAVNSKSGNAYLATQNFNIHIYIYIPTYILI